MQIPFYYYNDDEISILVKVIDIFKDFIKENNLSNSEEDFKYGNYILEISENIKNKQYLENKKSETLCQILSLCLASSYILPELRKLDYEKISYLILKTMLIYDKMDILKFRQINSSLLESIKKELKYITIMSLTDEEAEFYAKLFGYKID